MSSIHISKRDGMPFAKALMIRLIGVLLSLVVCAVVIVALTKLNPVEVYKAIFSGAVGTSRRAWVTIRDALILLCVAIMIYGADHFGTAQLIPMMVVGSIVAGMIWGLIPAFFKAHWNTNETLFTLMMNYVAMQIITFCIVFWENPAGSNTVGIINSKTKLGWLPALSGLTYGWIVVIVLVITVAMFGYLKYSKQGYEISVVGESENTAKYVGINVKKVIMRTMAISGAICGLAGFIIVSGSSHTISTSTAGGRGFTAIIVAWLSKFNTFTMVVISFFLVFMEQGAGQIASQFNLNENASEVITEIILFFILGSEFFVNYKIQFKKKEKGGHTK